MAPTPFTRGTPLAPKQQTRPAAPLPRAATSPVPKAPLRPRDLIGNVVTESFLGAITLPLRKLPLYTSMALGFVGFSMPTRTVDFGALNTEPFINAASWFGNSSFAWAGLGCAWGLMRGLHVVLNAKRDPYADFFGQSE